MNCEEVMELMQRHIDGDLNGDEQKKLTDHLEACPDCAEMMERLEQIDNDLANLPKVVPSFSLVDSILPRLQEIDAASGEWNRVRDEAAGRAPERPARPWYARGAFVRIGGAAAAAAVLGVLIVNGLSDSFGGVSSEQSTAASEEASQLMAADTAAPASEAPAEAPANAGNMAMSIATPKVPAADEAASEPEAGAAEGSRPDASNRAAPVDVAEAPSDEGANGAFATPAPAPTPNSGAEGTQGVTGGGTDEGAGAGQSAKESAPEPEPSPEAPGLEEGPQYGIAAGPFDGMRAEDQYGEPLRSEDGTYSAEVKRFEDGTAAVTVIWADGEYVSPHRWAEPEASIELVGWDGAALTYRVKLEDGVRTFTIDAAASSETEAETAPESTDAAAP